MSLEYPSSDGAAPIGRNCRDSVNFAERIRDKTEISRDTNAMNRAQTKGQWVWADWMTGVGVIWALGLSALAASAADEPGMRGRVRVLADHALLRKSGARILQFEPETGVALGELDSFSRARLQLWAHREGKCGGFEALPQSPFRSASDDAQLLLELRDLQKRDQKWQVQSKAALQLESRPEIVRALPLVDASQLKTWVSWLSSFNSRVHTASDPNVHVEQLRSKLVDLLAVAKLPATVDLVGHRATRQKSIRVRLPGSVRPDETVVLGAHLDSINQDWFGSGKAPGADDNASGSANLLEALRVLLQQGQPERSVELFWYAGEEGGLLGSAEIAAQYKAAKRKVVGVLQLDMTLYPGDGAFVLGSMTDFTSPWMRQYLSELNRLYLGAKIIEDQCGYGCSDHASWHRSGYAAIMPFEATFDRMNSNLHTPKDVIDSASHFEHSAMFSRLAVAIAMDLGNSTLTPP